ncbi:MAG: redox-sensing transcriptional repressor Rex [Bacilli bacterium]|nr:redox-sensing transcriptional repressor Rex [Bacilli bacterium]
MKDVTRLVSTKQLERFPIYLNHLLALKKEGKINTSAPQIAAVLGFSEEQVRKDLQVVTKSSGKPKAGRVIDELIRDINEFLGYGDTTGAVVVGCGHLGEAFMKYEGFLEYGLEILAGFDVASKKIGKIINGKKIYSMNNLEKIIMQLNVQIAIITVPSEEAQGVVDRLVNCGIKGIWNFANVHISAPDDVVIETVNLASSLAVLSHKLTDK